VLSWAVGDSGHVPSGLISLQFLQPAAGSIHGRQSLRKQLSEVITKFLPLNTWRS